MEEQICPKDAERIKTVEASTAGRRMLEKTARSVSTKLLYTRGVLLFKQFLGRELDDVVEEYKKDAQADLYKAFEKWEEIFDDFSLWLEKQGWRGFTPLPYFQGAKNLINANVPKSARLQVKMRHKGSRKIPPITIEDLRRIRKITDERESAFIDLLKDSGISRDDAIEMNYGHVKKAVEDPAAQYVPIRMYRSKEDVEYVTWIGLNAVESLRLFFDIRKRRGETITDKTPIFASNNKPYEQLNKRSLSQLLTRLRDRTGIAISTHRLRKFFETYVAAGGVHPATAKYWMGHQLAGTDVESRYIIPPENLQRDMYEKAYPYIDLREESEEMIVSEALARLETMSPRQAELFFKEIEVKFGAKLVKRVKKEYVPKTSIANGGVAYGVQCQRVVAESELPQLLAEGWRVAAVLPSGKIVVEN